MRKSESIYKLEEVGLNTLDYFITKERSEVLHYLAKHSKDSLSLRTERGDEFQCPYYYNMTGEALYPIAMKLLNENYLLLISPVLDTEKCEAFGAIALSNGTQHIAEVVFGKGKCRELYSHPDMRHISLSATSLRPVTLGQGLTQRQEEMLNQVYKKVKEVLYDEIPCVVEFSIYSDGVGRLGTKDIYWEVRPYK